MSREERIAKIARLLALSWKIPVEEKNSEGSHHSDRDKRDYLPR